MAQWKKFSGLRTYPVPLQRDLRELERYLGDIESRVARLTGNEPVSVRPHQPPTTPPGSPPQLVKHAPTHASTLNGATFGTDSIDPYRFDWTERHRWLPATDITPITIAPSDSQTADLVQITPSGLDEDASVGSPILWLVADDVNIPDGGSVISWVDRVAARVFTPRTSGTLYRTSVANGHDAVEKTGAGSAATMETTSTFALTGTWSAAIVYKAIQSGSHHMFGRTADNANTEGFIAGGKHASTTQNVITRYNPNSDTVGSYSSNLDYNLVVIRRDGSNNHYVTQNGIDITPSTPVARSGDMDFEALFSLGASAAAPSGTQILELLVYDTFLTTSALTTLVGYLSTKYALSAGTGYDARAVFDSDGRLGLLSDPVARLHVSDFTEQLRVGFDGSNYTSFTADSGGDITIEPTGGLLGINTSPSANVHIAGDGTVYQIRMEHSGSGSYGEIGIIASGGPIVFTSSTDNTYRFRDASGANYLDLIPHNSDDTFYLDLTSLSDFTFLDPVVIDNTGTQLTLDDGGAGDAQFDYSSSLLTITAPDINLVSSGTTGVGINESDPDAMLHITSNTTDQIKLEHNGTNYATLRQQSGIFEIDSQSANFLISINKNLFLGGDASTAALQWDSDAILHVQKADTTVGAHANADDTIFEFGSTSSAHYGVSFLSGSLSNQHIYFGDNLDNDRGQINYLPGTSGLQLLMTGPSGGTTFITLVPATTASGALTLSGNPANNSSSYTLDVIGTVSRNTGASAVFRNSADNKQYMKVGAWGADTSYAPGTLVGYGATIAGHLGTLLSFSESDTNTGKIIRAGLVGTVFHSNTGIAADRLMGVGGGVGISTLTNVTTNFVYGVVGAASCSADASASGKTIAGVVGRLTGSGLVSGTDMQIANPDSEVNSELKGSWDHAATFWADALPAVYDYGAGSTGQTIPTNLPSILSAYKATVPEATDGEAWSYYCNTVADIYTGSSYPYFPNYGPTPTVAGVLRAPWPRSGSRKTHIYFIPGLDTETSSNVVGDVYFDDGTNGPIGLWEHDGTAFRYVLDQTDYSTDNSGSAPTFRNMPTGVDAAQDAWLKIRIDDGTAAGRDVWIPVWF